MKINRLFAATLLSFAGLSAQALPEYQFVDLGTLGGSSAIAYGLNDQRQVVGSATTASGAYQAFVWQNGSMTSLGFNGIARAINNGGEIVGETGSYGGWTNPQIPDGTAFHWQNGVYTNLGNVSSSSNNYSGAYDINDNGQITGFTYTDYSTDSTASHGFIAERDGNGNYAMSDLGAVSPAFPNGYSRGHGINQAGEIVGRGSALAFDNSNKHMIHWDANGQVQLDYVTTPATSVYGTAEDINNNGQAVGVIRFSVIGVNNAYIWDVNTGTFTLMALPAGFTQAYGWAINDAGVAVGYMATSNFGGGFIPGSAFQPKAFIYTLTDGMIDLNALVLGQIAADGWVLTSAYDINSYGDIVGIGTKNGQTRAFLLQAVAEVPVPAAAWLMGSGLLGLMALSRRQRQ